MKKLLSLFLVLALLSGCEDKEKEHKDCDCHPEAGEMLDGGLDVDAGVEDAGEEVEAGEEAEGGEEAPDAGSEDAGVEAGSESGEEAVDCEACEGEDCDC